MNASILIVGSVEFHATLLDRLHYLATCSVEVIPSTREVMSSIQVKKPDLLIFSANQASSWEICRMVKQNSSLAWIYCIFVSDQPAEALSEILPGWNWELGLRAAALEVGADACCWLSSKKDNCKIAEAEWRLQNWLLTSQIQTGIRQVEIYRNLMQSNDYLSAIALADPLTELSNRRALDWELPRQINNARTRSTPLSLLILDVDYFKSVNDTHGHLVGDRVLQLLSARLRHNLRFQDTPFRYGGEELVIILNNTKLTEAKLVAERINFLIATQPFMIDKKLALKITVSIGVATLKANDDDQGVSLLDRADQNLLKAKSSGRNRVVAQPEEGD
ncbi:GGDEF domain-containing protein [Aerosakkonemataceae cyanobacterium BLCC-F154]|uniref:GGDEF domain-containing protein n=1 Tax=Floridaenema fluviatile BLCC-F154 TaxID=3153640 RepID=A0ABV4YI08_9CYAN